MLGMFSLLSPVSLHWSRKSEAQVSYSLWMGVNAAGQPEQYLSDGVGQQWTGFANPTPECKLYVNEQGQAYISNGVLCKWVSELFATWRN